MKKFTKQNLNAVRVKMNEVLKEAGLEGVEFSVGNCRFTETEATFKVIAKTEGNDEKVAEEIKEYAKLYNIPSIENHKWKLISIDRKKYKYPFIAIKKTDGKQYKLSIEQVQSEMKVA